MKKKEENTATKKSYSNRVLVYRVDAPRRPAILTLDDRILCRKDNLVRFGKRTNDQEAIRRQSLYDLMTDDERAVFQEYCRLRDE